MHLFRRLISLTIAMATLFALSLSARPMEKAPPQLYLSVFNDAGVDSRTLHLAQTRASAVLARAGVYVEWLNCTPTVNASLSPGSLPCSAVAWPRHLSVRILERGVTVGKDTFGQSFLDSAGCGSYSNVYFGNLAASRAHPGLRDGEMLGYVIAHEVGHLLLGTNSHSEAGVMQAHWQSSALEAAARGHLFFSKQEEESIRARLEKKNSQLTLR